MRKEKLKIVYQDKDIIVVSKDTNLLTIGTERERENTLYHKVLMYERSKHKANKIFIVHRLDKDTSGIIVFAKNENIKTELQREWENTKRKYVSLVEGKVSKSGTIKNWLKETKTLYTYSSTVKNDGKLAITKYKPIISNKQYTLLDIEILTGRKNQIRVHMKDIGHPIVGDKKYGSKKNPIRRMTLHATYLKMKHPKLNKEIEFKSKYPEIFDKLVNRV